MTDEYDCELCGSAGASPLHQPLAGWQVWLLLCPACAESVFRPACWPLWLAACVGMPVTTWRGRVEAEG